MACPTSSSSSSAAVEEVDDVRDRMYVSFGYLPRYLVLAEHFSVSAGTDRSRAFSLSTSMPTSSMLDNPSGSKPRSPEYGVYNDEKKVQASGGLLCLISHPF